MSILISFMISFMKVEASCIFFLNSNIQNKLGKFFKLHMKQNMSHEISFREQTFHIEDHLGY
jgi:hypothetical protein